MSLILLGDFLAEVFILLQRRANFPKVVNLDLDFLCLSLIVLSVLDKISEGFFFSKHSDFVIVLDRSW